MGWFSWLSSGLGSGRPEAAAGDGRLDPEMERLIETWLAMQPHIPPAVTPVEARRQPTLADAAHRMLRQKGMDRSADLKVLSDEIVIDGADEDLPARVYRMSEHDDAATPVLLYFQGGGWVTADINVYDASARAMCRLTGAVVVSVHYRQGPEHRFPAAHDDAWAAWRWLLRNARSLGGDPRRMAVMGESAGGNLAAHVAVRARDERVAGPVHLTLVYPVAGGDMDTLSYRAHLEAKPLNRAMMGWYFSHYLTSPHELADPRIDLAHADLKGLPQTTVVSAELDPLLSEGQALVQRLRAQGVKVRHETYAGVTHEFFGLGLLVKAAAAAETFAARELRAAFNAVVRPV